MNKPIHHQTLFGYQKRQVLLEIIRDEPRTLMKLCEATGALRSALRRHIDILHHGTPKQIYISGYEFVRGKPAPIYAVGGKPDVDPILKERRANPRVDPELTTTPAAPQSWLSSLGL